MRRSAHRRFADVRLAVDRKRSPERNTLRIRGAGRNCLPRAAAKLSLDQRHVFRKYAPPGEACGDGRYDARDGRFSGADQRAVLRRAFGSPVLLVAGMHNAFLLHHADAHTAITLASNHRRVPADSYNISARVASDSAASPLVVLTPRTGWWESTAERAGGIIAWLAALSAGAALHRESRLRRDVIGFATCGHELGHLGLNALLQQQQHLLSSAACWLPLGANLGCASNATLFLRSTQTADSEHMRNLLVAEGYPVGAICIEPVSKASGEGRDIVDHGGKILSMAGSNAHFHAASDRWPGNVSSSRTAA